MDEIFTESEKAVLAPYVTNADRPIFALRNLPEEVIAVLFAYYSRSRDSLRRNLLKLIQEGDLDLTERLQLSSTGGDALAAAREKARQFHEKWVVGYGHSSVAEHAVAHLAVEDVSIVCSKVIEDTRLAAYTEKSTRYVVFDPERFYRPPSVMASPHGGLYEKTASGLLRTYTDLTGPVMDAVKARHPRGEKQTEGAYNAACRAKACDILRYLLPAATTTNIGITINARVLEHLITKLLSHPLEEARACGASLKDEATTLIPTLIKYAGRNAYMAETRAAIEGEAARALAGEAPAPSRPVTLIRYDERAEDMLVASVLYEASALPFTQVLGRVEKLPAEEKARILDEYLSDKRRGKHDPPLRALEHVYYTFDILVDFGAFRDIQRHRMATQTPQELGPAHGYCMPPEIEAFGHRQVFEDWMARAERAHQAIARDFPREAPYVLPLAFRKRVLFTWNLREIHHFVQLRSAPQGHISYRTIAQEVYRELERVQPLLARYIRVDLKDYDLGRLGA
jgi:thymidylate synthase ThyX